MGSPVKYNKTVGEALTASSTKVLEADSKRIYLLIQNHDNKDIFVGFDEEVDAGGVGFLIIPAGGNYEPLLPPAGSINLRSSLGTAQFVILHARN